MSDNYVSKTLFGVSEFANIVRAGAKTLSGEALLCANLGFGCRLTSNAGGVGHAMPFDTGPEGAIFLRNCANPGVTFGDIECIAVSHGHWDHMGALPATLGANGDRELGAVAAHERDEQMPQADIADRIDHAGEPRQHQSKQEPSPAVSFGRTLPHCHGTHRCNLLARRLAHWFSGTAHNGATRPRVGMRPADTLSPGPTNIIYGIVTGPDCRSR